MKADFNSLTARLYRWFYNICYMPTSLCPYFWKCLIMYILIIPYAMFTFPIRLTKHYKRDYLMLGDDIIDQIMSSIIIYMIIAIIGCTLFTITTMWFMSNTFIMKYVIIYIIGSTVIVISIILLIVMGFNNKKTKYDNILISFIKSKYKKYCPKLDWKN
jgi:hypothetical protein